MQEMPGTMNEALSIANRQETAEMAQKRLHKEKHQVTETLAVETDTSLEQKSTNAIRRSKPSEIEELTTQAQVRQLAGEVARLHGERDGKQCGPVCWGCRDSRQVLPKLRR